MEWAKHVHVQLDKVKEIFSATTLANAPSSGGLRRPFLSWISEFPTYRISMSVNHWHPKTALNPETSKKE
jgi:hypothetical protein